MHLRIKKAALTAALLTAFSASPQLPAPWSQFAALAPAHAATAEADALTAFGFFGNWSLRCDRPPSPANVLRQAYISAAGEPGFTESLGSDVAQNTYRILGARVTGNVVVIDIELNGTIRQKLTMQREGKRIRTMANELPDGRVMVKDGKVVATGGATPWLNRCDTPL